MIPIWDSFLRAREKEKMEIGLEPFLSLLALELEINPVLENALVKAAEHSPSPLREEMEAGVQRYTEKGMRLEESLLALSQKWESSALSRVVALLMNLCVQGSTRAGIEGLRRVAEDLRVQQHTRVRAFAQKLTLLSLVFIGVSALVPAMFLAFVTIGSRFLELSLSASDVLLITLLGFPLADAIVLGIVWIQTPQVLLKQNSSIKKISFSVSNALNEWKKKFSNEEWNLVVRASVIEGCSLFLIAWSAYLYFHSAEKMGLVIVGMIGFIPLVAHAIWRDVSQEKELLKLERQLPDSLVLWASFPHSFSFEKSIHAVAESSQVPIQKEWENCSARIRKGMSVSAALKKWGGERSSFAIEKAKHVLLRGYETGVSIQGACSTLAHELLVTQSLAEEQRATLLIQKYTLLGAGGIMIPLLLGVLVGVISGLPFSNVEVSGVSGEALFHTALLAIHGYLILYAVLASLFVSVQEGKPALAGLYGIILIPLAQIVYLIGMRVSA